MNTPLTFLFTDLENSTQLWEQFSEEMHPALARHDALLSEIIAKHEGKIVKSTGDGFHAVFDSPSDGVLAAMESQKAIGRENWPAATGPLKVRIGLHTGESEARDGDYFGPTLNRAARVMDIAHGGQILLSETTANLSKSQLPPNTSLLDKGQHRLKGIASLERIYQLSAAELQNSFPPLRSLETFKHNLHRQLTSFVGREKELTEIQRLLTETQLLTLLGPGGTGKTRLMLQTAEEVIEKYPDGVWLVELAPLTNPNKIADRVAAALNVQEQPGRTINEILYDYLRQKELLLLLDNVEHLVRECAEFTEHLLTHCPKITILITGREALFISGETTQQIPSLSLPDKIEDISLEDICHSEGVQLFAERAQAVRPQFEITPQNAPAIAEIVKRLDGIPLALELAAARMRMLTVEQIADRLNDRFRLLTGGHRTALPRQQTLQALIDWSWNLLDEDEQLLLCRLSVFSGGWTLETAQAVVGFEPLDEFTVFDLLEQLINKSMVIVEYPSEGQARYSLLESIRQYSRDKLFEAGEGEDLRNRHAEYYAAFSQEAEPHLARSTMVPWVKRIEQELNNLRAAMTWTLDNRPELALRISGSLLYRSAHWIHFSEARSWLKSSVERTRQMVSEDETGLLIEDFIKGLIALATAHAFYSDHLPALKTIEEAIQLAEENDQFRHIAYGVVMKTTINANGAGPYNSPEWVKKIEEALELTIEHGFDIEFSQLQFVMAFLHAEKGRFEEAMPYFKVALETAEKIDNPFRKGEIYRSQAAMAFIQGNYEASVQAIQLALENFVAINDQRFILVTQSDLAHFYRRTGSLEEAIPLYRETILKWQVHGNLPALAHQFECFAYMAISQNNFKPAARLLGAARKIRSKTSAESILEREINELNQAMDQLAEALDEAERDRLMEEGAGFSLDDAVSLALAEVQPISV